MANDTSERHDIFLSYARDDEERAGQFVRLFEKQGWSVFWDQSIQPGQFWRDMIEKQLDGSRTVVVLWTRRSRDSRWVREEAERAARAGKLVPVKLDADVQIPAGFGEIQDADLSDFWLKSGPKAARPLLEALRHRLDDKKHPAAAAQLEEQLASLCQQRAELKAQGQRSSELDQQIRNLKRAIRSGPQLHPGDNFLDRFSLQQKLGQGGFGSIWKAWDSIGEQFVALKILHGQYSDSSSRIRRFFRGARRMAQLQHPHIVRVLLDKGEEDDYRFFAMQYMPGGNLAEAVRRGALSQAEILHIILDIASALQCACEQDQLVHRDVKPANILLTAANRGVLTDFDLVWAPDTTQGTQIGQGLGTFDFGAPEVLRGEANVTPASDVFSLARTALWALAGGSPVGRSLEEVGRELDKLKLSEGQKQALRRALQENPGHRFDSALAFSVALDYSESPSNQAILHKPVANGKPTPEGEMGSKINPVDGTELIRIPAGPFIMGSDDGPKSERPQHEEHLEEYFIARHPVTNAQYRRFIEAIGHREPYSWDDKRLIQPNQPVVRVSWHDAVAYCRWAGLRLPSEAEWEKAARGTDGRRWPWGNDAPTEKHCNFDTKVGSSGEVGSYPQGASPYGCHDMAGNVWEWCSTKWREDYSQQADDPLEGNGGRVLRGGSFYNNADGVRCARRIRYDPHDWNRRRGFRCAQ